MGVLFCFPIDKVWKDYEFYLFPYLAKIKNLASIKGQLKVAHNQNISNVLECLKSFMNGVMPFEEQKNEPWAKDLYGPIDSREI